MDSLTKVLNDGIKGKQCYINVLLEGEIDLSSLNNKNLEEIHFVKGEITRIYNVPSGVKKIVINDNELTEIPYQKDLVHLEANNNHLTKVDLSKMNNLVLLFLNNNQISKITNLPPLLETLSVNNNDLEELDLTDAKLCKNVSCVNNPRLYQIIAGKQISDSEFKLNKDPNTQIQFEARGPKQKHKENVLYTDNKQAINEYYALKNRYEEHRKDVIKKIMNGIGLRKEKINKVKNAAFKCINCGKNGGSIFTKESSYLRCICGNTQNPCNLDIEILSRSDYEIFETKKIIDFAKQRIVQIKMNTLFGYTKEEKSIKEFEKNINIIKTNQIRQNLIKNLKESYYDMQNDTEKVSNISKKMQTVYSELAEIRRIMEEYARTENEKLITEVAHKQLLIKENLNVVRSIKYPICEI